MEEIQNKLMELEILISNKREDEDSNNLSTIHRLISEASTIAGTYPEEAEPYE